MYKGWDNLNQEDIRKRLQNIKSLAERGIGGEKENALKLYEELKSKYNFDDNQINDDPIEMEWFRYKDDLEKKLLCQICYMVTGSDDLWSKGDKKYKLVGAECTEFEKKEIEVYFEYYKRHLKEELGIFITAFCSANRLYPNEDARCYKETEENLNEDKSRRKRAAFMSVGMECHIRPRNLLKEKD